MGPNIHNALQVMRFVYRNHFCWSGVKSWVMFFFAVRLAKEFTGFQVMIPF